MWGSEMIPKHPNKCFFCSTDEGFLLLLESDFFLFFLLKGWVREDMAFKVTLFAMDLQIEFSLPDKCNPIFYRVRSRTQLEDMDLLILYR